MKLQSFWRKITGDWTWLPAFGTGHVWTLAFVALVLAGFLPTLPAASYYIATNGNNSNAGSQGSPWLTLQKAADTMTAGDTVIVSAGTYNEIVTTKFNGTSGNPISFVATDGVTNNGFVINNAWQSITGFNLNGSGIGSFSGTIVVSKDGHHLTCTSNVLNWTNPVYQPSYLAIYSGSPTNSIWNANKFLSTPFMGLSVLGRGHLFTNNVWNSQRGGDALRLLCSNTTLTRNTFTNWSDLSGGVNPEHADLIQAFSNNGEIATNNLIEDNLFINCINVQLGVISDLNMLGEVGGWTYRNNIWVNVSWQMTINARDIKFYNNTFYRCATNSGHPFSLSAGDTANLHFASVDTNTSTITVTETVDIPNGQFIKFIDPDGTNNTHVLPLPLTPYGGANYYYAHVVGQTLTVHTNAEDATNGSNRVNFSTAGSGTPFVTSFYNRNTSEGSRVFNNIFLENGRDTTSWIQGWFGVSQTFTNVQAGNNLVRGTGCGSPDNPRYGCGTAKYVNANYWHTSYGLNGYDPMLLNPGNGNVRLQPGSPAIGAGTNLNTSFTTDITGATRTGPWDIGAYQSDVGIVKRPRPPGFLSIP